MVDGYRVFATDGHWLEDHNGCRSMFRNISISIGLSMATLIQALLDHKFLLPHHVLGPLVCHKLQTHQGKRHN